MWVAAPIVAVIGLAFLFRGVWRLREQHRWVSARGVVREHATINPTGDPGDWLLAPVVEFRTDDGRSVRARDPVGTNPPRFRPGDEVQVRYDPADPSRIVVGGSLWIAVLHFAIGIVLLLVAAAILARA
jgi:hypothetical protein